MRVKEIMAKVIEQTIDDYRLRLARVEERRSLVSSEMLAKIEEILASTENEVEVDFLCYGYSQPTLRLTTKSIDATRKLVTKLLEITEIREFEKEFVHYDEVKNVAKWRETAETSDLVMEVEPAEPSPDCDPVKRINSYTSWSCEKR